MKTGNIDFFNGLLDANAESEVSYPTGNCVGEACSDWTFIEVANSSSQKGEQGDVEAFMLNKMKVILEPGKVQLRIGNFDKTFSTDNSWQNYFYVTTNYDLKYRAFDGVPIAGDRLSKMLSEGTSSIDGRPLVAGSLKEPNRASFCPQNLFAFFSEEKRTLGLLVGSAGASGGSASTLILVDTVTGEHTEVAYQDHETPQWLCQQGVPFLAEQTKLFYLGSHSSMFGVAYLVEGVKELHKGQWVYSADASKGYWRRMIREHQLSFDELTKIQSFKSISDDAVANEAVKKIFVLLYYSKQLGDFDLNRKVQEYCSRELWSAIDIYSSDLVLVNQAIRNTSSEYELSKKQLEIMQTVMSHDGYLTKRMHSLFWDSFPASVRKELRAIGNVAKFKDSYMMLVGRFQRASWASIEASLYAKRVIRTPEYVKLARQLQESELPKEPLQKSLSNAEGLIQAAATGIPFNSVGGEIVITPELVERVEAGLDASLNRVACLVNPDWTGEDTKVVMDK